ncbi:MAG: hypothetical protein IAG13_04980, partial [Deltaproteobacteria bacterium]|nr:hypothetical protein [Nannocystaceae bacterium]
MLRSPRSLSLVFVLAACATKPDAPTAAPAPAPARERPEDGNFYVSTSHNESGADAKRFAPVTTPAGDFVVTTPEA